MALESRPLFLSAGMILIALSLALGLGSPTSASPSVVFVDRTSPLGLTMGTDAACWVDIDNDGWTDLIVSGVVWKNVGGKRFARFADMGGSVVAADFDNDGFVDLFCYSTMKLYHNVEGKRFVEAPLPKLPKTVSRGACWGDFDGDGFVDLYIGGYEDWDAGITYPSLILMNQKGKSFKLVWSDAAYRTRGVTACDFNRDNALDVYVSNYRLQPNQLWMNDGKGHFKDVALEKNAVATSPGFDGGHTIGSCWGDFDNDGEFDLFVATFAHVDSRGDQPKSRFLRNLGPKQGYAFDDLGTCGVFYQESYATPAAGDFDNDGLLDLYLTTVYAPASFGKPNHPVLFRNESGFKFTDVTASSGLADLPPTYQAAWADFRHNGSLDLVTAGKLFVNQGNKNAWLEVRLQGDGSTVNRSAIGSQVRIKRKHGVLTRQVEGGTGEGNQNDLVLHFGLGAAKTPVDIEITWPNGKTQRIRHVRPDQMIDVKYSQRR